MSVRRIGCRRDLGTGDQPPLVIGTRRHRALGPPGCPCWRRSWRWGVPSGPDPAVVVHHAIRAGDMEVVLAVAVGAYGDPDLGARPRSPGTTSMACSGATSRPAPQALPSATAGMTCRRTESGSPSRVAGPPWWTTSPTTTSPTTRRSEETSIRGATDAPANPVPGARRA